MLPRCPTSTLFPYTTLFRSEADQQIGALTTWFEFAGADTTRLHAEIVADLLDQQDVEIGECILAIDRMIRGLEDSKYLMKKGRSTVGCDQSLKMPVAPIGVPHHFNL